MTTDNNATALASPDSESNTVTDAAAADKPRTQRIGARPYGRYLAIFLALTIGSVWALTCFYLFAYDTAVAILGELATLNPVVIIILHSPMIAAIVVYLMYDGWRGLLNFLKTLIPRRKDLVWIPVLMGLMLVYIFAIRWVCQLFGIDVPPEPLAPLDMLIVFLQLFVMEIGMIAIAFGWYGFFLPFMHRVTGSHLISGIATGVGIGVFVAPGNMFASFELATAWPLYVAQLCVLSIGMSMMLSHTKGNILFFLLPFWVSASGSWLDLYIFKTSTQFVQIGLFAALVVVLYFFLRSRGGGKLAPMHTFPEFVEQSYTERVGAVILGRGNRSLDDKLAGQEPSR